MIVQEGKEHQAEAANADGEGQEEHWLGMMDSNHRYLIQSQAAYH